MIADANPDSALAVELEGFTRWYAQPGTPQVKAQGDYDAAARSYRLTLSQSNPAGPGQASQPPQVIPVVMGWLGPDGAALPLRLADGIQTGACQRTLFRCNPAAFHRADDAGYVLWADKVLELDAINPQLAARVARALDHWRRLAEPWRSAAGEAVARVAARPDLSSDLREIIDKAMAS